MDYKAVGKRIRQQRIKLDLTQSQAAELADISEKYYANVERGANKARLEIYFKIAQALNISLDSLVSDDCSENSMAYMNYIISEVKHFSSAQKEMLHDLIQIINKYDIKP